MAKLVYVCTRDPGRIAAFTKALAAIADRLTPDNIAAVPPLVSKADGILVCISNPSNLVRTLGSSVCLGYLVGSPNWDQPLTGRPDGAYALCRADDQHVELVADELASRTIWYFKDEALLIASTSQRAIVTLLGRFNFNPDVVPWMLATGTLGPGLSWDRRIAHVGAATTITLDRSSWTLTTKTEIARFSVLEASGEAHESRLRTSLKHVMGAENLDRRQWALALSGGIDCRTILCMLDNTAGLKAVTWGLRASQQERDNDAYVARELARHYGLDHKYYETDLSEGPIERVFERYLRCGEGRIDHISGYMDGFQLWKLLYESGIRGVIRGDQVFGRKYVRSPQDVRMSAGMPLWSDFRGAARLEEYGISPQILPDPLSQQPRESLETWRDRLQQHYRVPFVLAGLSDLKLPYVEIVSPLLSGSLVEEIRKLPDELRTNKILLRSIAQALSPDLGFAKYTAAEKATSILKSAHVATYLTDWLFATSSPLIPHRFVELIREAAAGRAQEPKLRLWKKRMRRAAAAYLPPWILPRRKMQPTEMRLDASQLAFRVYLICRMDEILAEDAASVSRISA